MDPVAQVRAQLVEQLDEQRFQLPLLPRVASQVLGLASDDRSSAKDLASLIHQDQALAGHLLKVVNSAAYAGRSVIVSLQQAIARLGLDRLREVAFAVCIKSRIFQLPGYRREMRQLWRQSIISSSYGKEIALLRRQNLESAFLCGLLHNIGKPVAFQAIADLQKTSRERLDKQSVLDLVEEFHVSFGGLIASAWSLPDPVKESILYYEDYTQANSFVLEVQITCLAHHLANHVMCSDEPDESLLCENPVIAELNLYPDDMAALLAKKDAFLEISDHLSI